MNWNIHIRDECFLQFTNISSIQWEGSRTTKYITNPFPRLHRPSEGTAKSNNRCIPKSIL
jgi:hypothetical protein